MGRPLLTATVVPMMADMRAWRVETVPEEKTLSAPSKPTTV